jgi:hypothetical protein
MGMLSGEQLVETVLHIGLETMKQEGYSMAKPLDLSIEYCDS